MQTYELPPLINNLYRKDKESWEQARLVAYVIAQSNSTKRLKPTDILSFNWDKPESDKETSISSSEIARLRDKANQYLKQI